jgi:hypothetical protein
MSRTSTLWTFAITSIALFMVTLDNIVVTTARPVIRKENRCRHHRSRLDLERLHAHVRGAAPGRCRPRRSLRPPAAVRHRTRHLHARLGGRGTCAVSRGTDRARAAQWIGGAIVTPLTLTIFSAAVPAEKRGVALIPKEANR